MKKNLNKHKHLFEMIDWNYEQPNPNRRKYGKRNNKKPFCLMSVSKTNIKRKTWKSFQFKVPLFSLHCTRKLFGIYVCRTSTFVRYFHCPGFIFFFIFGAAIHSGKDSFMLISLGCMLCTQCHLKCSRHKTFSFSPLSSFFLFSFFFAWLLECLFNIQVSCPMKRIHDNYSSRNFPRGNIRYQMHFTKWLEPILTEIKT